MILRTRRSLISRARPASAWPALLLTTVRSVAPHWSSASISSIGWPALPKPPISTVAPSWMPATASAAVAAILSMFGTSLLWLGCGWLLFGGVDVFEHDGQALADADADGGHAPAPAAGFQPAGQGAQDADAGGAPWGAGGPAAAPGVDRRRVHVARVEAGRRLRGEGLVQTDGGDFLPADTGPLH